MRRARHPSRPRTAKHRGRNGTPATVAAPKPQEYVADRSPISAGHPRSTRAARLRASPPARQAERHSRTVLTLRCTAPDSPSQAVSRISSRRVPEEIRVVIEHGDEHALTKLPAYEVEQYRRLVRPYNLAAQLYSPRLSCAVRSRCRHARAAAAIARTSRWSETCGAGRHEP